MVVGLDALDKTLLSLIYTCSLDSRNVFETVERIPISDEMLKKSAHIISGSLPICTSYCLSTLGTILI